MDIVSREDAKAKGLKRYFTGKACKRGHVSERFVSNRMCIDCVEHDRKKNHSKHMAWWNKYNKTQCVKHAEHRKKATKRWREANPEKVRTQCRNRVALRKSAPGSHTTGEVVSMLEKQKWKCVGCGVSIKKCRHIDHIIPLRRGGSNDIGNLQGLCPKCNANKHAKDPIEWARELGRLL